MLSYQSLIPAGAGTRRYEKSRVVVWYSESARRILPRPTPTPAGDKPPRYIFSFRHRPSVYNSARFAGGEPASKLIGGHIFVRMTNWGAGMTRSRNGGVQRRARKRRRRIFVRMTK